MLLKSFTLLTSLTLLSSTHALGRAIVSNLCSSPLYLWSVGSTISPQHVLSRDSSYSEPFRRDPLSGGIALKLTSVENGIFMPNVSQTIFAYNLDGDTIWYDMSGIFGDGFFGTRLEVKPSEAGCEGISWPFGRKPAGSGGQVRSCGKETDLVLEVCAGRCLPSWSSCGNAAPGDTRTCCTHCIGSHHCVAPPDWA